MSRTDLYIPFHDSEGMPLQTALVVCRPSIGPLVLQALLQNAPYLVILLHSSSDALEVTKDVQPNILFLEYELQDGNGIALYDLLRTKTLVGDVPTYIMGVLSPEQEDDVIMRQLESLQWQPRDERLFAALKDIFVTPYMHIV